MPRFVKICGFRDKQTVLETIEQEVSENLRYLGFNLIERSPRFIPPDAATLLIRDVWDSGKMDYHEPVFLFSDHPASFIADFTHGIFNSPSSWTVQLHGNESPEFVASLPEQLDIIKAVPFDPVEIDKWRGNDRLYALMIDAPKVEGEMGGGTGRSFDWQALADLDKTGLPDYLFLAGGLTPENVGEAIRIVQPYAVDVSSGVESTRGVKDVRLIQAFCEAVRQADAEST